MKTSKDTNIYHVVEIRTDDSGKRYCTAHDGWTVTDFPDTPVEIRIFTRNEHKIKVVVYNTPIDDLERFGTFLCKSYIEMGGGVWQRVTLGDLR